MVRIRKFKSIICNDEGSAIGLFVVIILSMTLLATASMTLAKTQYSWARFSRQTSNSYHLARSGAEKVVDSMNKEIAKVLPDLMKEASKIAHTKLMGAGLNEGVKYEGSDAYTGKYVGLQYENEYEIQLKNLIYNHIVDKFITTPTGGNDYSATKSDIKDPIEIKVKTNVYKNGSTTVPLDLASIAINLVQSAEMLNPDLDPVTGTDTKDAFMVEVTAWAEEGSKSSLTKSRVVGTISLKQLIKNEQLLEEYEWADAYPEAIQSAIISFGDFVINGDFEAKVEGDISVKGTKGAPATAHDAKMGDFPEPDEFGGIVVSDGGKLEVHGNALVVTNIQTTNSKEDVKREKTTKIKITQDAIAETIAINDNSSESSVPWETFVANNTIDIERNAYVDNDIRIGRYVKDGKITVANSVFGISDGDSHGVADGAGIYVDPNKSSGIYAMGRFPGDTGKIKMGRAFIAGQAFINFGDGNGYHRLYESAGEPFEDVYYLDKYREAYGEDEAYLVDFEGLINKEKIEIVDTYASKAHAYAPAMIAAGTLQDVSSGTPIGSQAEAMKIFYTGLDGSFPTATKEALTQASDWDNEIIGTGTNWGTLIAHPKNFYEGANPFKKNYFATPTPDPNVKFDNLIAYKGLQGYMLGKRGVFYQHFVTTGGTTGLVPKDRKFDELVNVNTFTTNQPWSRNNPIEVVTSSKDINLKDYNNMPTAIICTNPSAILTLKSQSGYKDFTGIIVTPGKIIIENEMTIHGIVIAGNESTGGATPKDIREGKHAGIQIESGAKVVFKYDMTIPADRDMIFNMHFMDKSLQRKLYDCLGMTSYGSVTSTQTDAQKIETIFGPNGKRKVKLSNESVISSNQEGLQFVMTSLKKIKN